jgi:serine/threonine protein kinase
MEDSSGSATTAGQQTELPPSERTTIDFEQPATLIGQHLDGRFLIEKNLTDNGADAGGIGVVYLARDTKLMGKQVVVKILQESALKHADIVRKFKHEKEALIRIDHPGIVRILDSGTLTDGNPFMVMDYIEGHSLRKLLQNFKQLPLLVAAQLMECVTDALGAAHAEKILHRDIKPENIMLTPQEDGFDRVRLIDFGIAKVGESELAPVTEIGRPIGTVLYIAPEQLIGSLDLTPSADIYAAAIVAYEMVTGELPFKPKNIAEMYQLEKEGVKVRPGELRPDLPRMAESILMAALDFDPAKRPQNARMFGKLLAAELRKDQAEATDEYFASIKTDFYISPTEAFAAADIQNLSTVTQAAAKKENPTGWKKFIIPAAAVGILLSGVLGYFAWNSFAPAGKAADPVTATIAAARTVAYFLTVQKMRDGKPYEAPFRSSGQEIFETGYKFSMTFQPDADGYMYVYNESRDQAGNEQYNLLFPTPTVNGGSSRVTAGQQIATAQNTFTGGKGTEVMWLIWTKETSDVLESVTKAAGSSGAITNAAAESLRAFIDSHDSRTREISKDSASQRTIVKTVADAVVHRFELEHR